MRLSRTTRKPRRTPRQEGPQPHPDTQAAFPFPDLTSYLPVTHTTASYLKGRVDDPKGWLELGSVRRAGRTPRERQAGKTPPGCGAEHGTTTCCGQWKGTFALVWLEERNGMGCYWRASSSVGKELTLLFLFHVPFSLILFGPVLSVLLLHSHKREYI